MNLAALLSLLALLAVVGWYLAEKSKRKAHLMDGGLHKDITLPHTDRLELYSNAFSHCSRKARLVLAELDLPYKHHHIDLVETGAYETISPAYLKVNPGGILPVLVHDGHPIYESDDILKYAAQIAGPDAPHLTPSDPEKLAEMNEWLHFCNITNDDPLAGQEARLGPCVPALTMPLFVTMMPNIGYHKLIPGILFHYDKRRPFFFTAAKLLGLKHIIRLKPLHLIVSGARDAARNHMATLNQALTQSGGDWILGDQFTLADITLASALLRLDEAGWLDYFAAAGTIPAVMAYYERLKGRESWQRAITDKEHPLVRQGSSDLKSLLRDEPTVRATLHP